MFAESNFTEDRAGGRDELQRHCEEVYGDEEETAEKQKEIILKFKTDGDMSRSMGKLLKSQFTKCSETGPGLHKKESMD